MIEFKGYVDIHSHILPGVDDGAVSLEESVSMLNIAYSQGIRRMYATPHFGSGKELCGIDTVKERFEELKEIAHDTGDDGIELLLGSELFYNADTIRMLNCGDALTMNGTKYVLVEFDYDIEFNKMYIALEDLLLSGYRPILAHIERYFCLRDSLYNINLLKNLSIYLQVNTSSVIMKFDSTSALCRKLVRGGLISFLGSDCHGTHGRPPCMKDAVNVLLKKTDEGILQRILFDNTDKLFSNQFI